MHRAHLGCRRKYTSWDFPFSPSAFGQRFRKTTQKTDVRTLRDAAEVAEYLPSMHRALGLIPGTVPYTTHRWKEENQFKTSE